MVGIGYDIHRLASGGNLVLGGIFIPTDIGTVAHSDGDVLLHAIIDALLGAAALGDIGEHFSDTNEQYKNISSKILLKATKYLLDKNNFEIVNIDATVVLEKPNLKKYKPAMQNNIANLLNLQIKQVSIKATTNEKLGPIGTGKAISALAICQLQQSINTKHS